MNIETLRIEFESQHTGRNLTRHRLRGTYVSAPIAALWNQHVRTASWMESSKILPLDQIKFDHQVRTLATSVKRVCYDLETVQKEMGQL